MKHYRTTKFIIFLMTLLCWNAYAQDQDEGYQSLSLKNLDAFKSPSKNWQVAGEVSSDLLIAEDITVSKGSGILVNVPKNKGNQDIFTKLEHGDIDIEFEFMIPKGSNSGMYFQGRYELQLLDSWGVKNPKYSDCGGIYERWDDSKPEGQKGYQGTAPRMNASKAPGLWQSMQVKFRAPKFNDQGEKVENAKFLEVVHNGVVIHENVVLTGPTRGSAFPEEGTMGPIRIQGDHGPVAFRNIKYKVYNNQRVTLNNLKYDYYVGTANVDSLPEDVLSTFKQTQKQVSADQLTWNYGEEVNDFGLVVNGQLEVPVAGNYKFTLGLAGGGKLEVNNQLLIDAEGQSPRNYKTGEIQLSAGVHPFKITYYKVTPWFEPALGLFAEGPGMLQHPLHAMTSIPDRTPGQEVLIKEVKDPYIIRGFVDFGEERKTHCASVGYPEGTHFSIDLSTGNILKVWRGGFCNASQMWVNRGGGPTIPLGSVIELTDAPVLARLQNSDAAWKSQPAEGEYTFKGYRLNGEGQPVFKYQLAGVNVEDFIAPEEKGLMRKLTIKGNNTDELWCRLATGKNIEEQKEGTYLIDDKTYYLTVNNTAVKPVIRSSENGQEILLPLKDLQEVSYTLMW